MISLYRLFAETKKQTNKMDKEIQMNFERLFSFNQYKSQEIWWSA